MPHRKKLKARILVVEDHPMTRMGLRMLIDGERDMEVCGEAASVGEGLDAALTLTPDLVITDVTLPGRSGLELTQDLHASCPDLPVLILSMHPEATYARRALEIGARGGKDRCRQRADQNGHAMGKVEPLGLAGQGQADHGQ